jgi:hypothetical protein
MRGTQNRTVQSQEQDAGDEHGSHLFAQPHPVTDLAKEMVAVAQNCLNDCQIFHAYSISFTDILSIQNKKTRLPANGP